MIIHRRKIENARSKQTKEINAEIKTNESAERETVKVLKK